MSRRADNISEQPSAVPAKLRNKPHRLQVPPDAAQKAARARFIQRRYGALLQAYLDEPYEQILHEVYQLGRKAVVEELSLLAIVEIHHAALRDVLAREPLPGERHTLIGSVLSEFLSAYEMNSRGYREASTAMRHLNEMLEDEVRRIAHAIHDGAGQYLACVHISLYSITKHVGPGGKEEIKRAHELLDELERHLRRVSHELRPRVLENAGLAGAVDFLVDGVAKRTGLVIHVVDHLRERPPVVVETALYRCIQEMLNNVVKHARAHNVRITLEDQGDALRCEVQDDGVGFDASDAIVRDTGPQLGFLGIQERIAVLGGKVAIESRPGNGVRISITVPL